MATCNSMPYLEEGSCYILLVFITLKMELHWRSNPIGKVRKIYLFGGFRSNKKFTQTLDSANKIL